jgi:hypothetical protein
MPSSKPLPMKNAVAVQSSLLARVAYDSRRAILQVTFRDGAAYQYAGVPIETYRGLLQADSKGAYFNHCIRDLYPYEVLRSKKRVTSG